MRFRSRGFLKEIDKAGNLWKIILVYLNKKILTLKVNEGN